MPVGWFAAGGGLRSGLRLASLGPARAVLDGWRRGSGGPRRLAPASGVFRGWVPSHRARGGRLSEVLGVLKPRIVRGRAGHVVRGDPDSTRRRPTMPTPFSLPDASSRLRLGEARPDEYMTREPTGHEQVTRPAIRPARDHREPKREHDTRPPTPRRRKGGPSDEPETRSTHAPAHPRGRVETPRNPRPSAPIDPHPASVVEGCPSPVVVTHPRVVVAIRPVPPGLIRNEVAAYGGRGRDPHVSVLRVVDPGPLRVEGRVEVGHRARILIVVSVSTPLSGSRPRRRISRGRGGRRNRSRCGGSGRFPLAGVLAASYGPGEEDEREAQSHFVALHELDPVLTANLRPTETMIKQNETTRAPKPGPASRKGLFAP
jgi:hypothetical protein